jgi:hypothetical protein
MKKRTSLDFSKHKLIIQENELVKIHHLKKPGTVIDNIKYINCGGVLSVTGDYGNWIFCREFWPSADGFVSDGYWLEKLSLSSDQTGKEYSPNETRKTIDEGLDGGLVEYGYEGAQLEEMIEYYQELRNFYVDLSEWEYIGYAYGEGRPDFIDAEDVPFEKVTQHWLKVVFDGFDEICKRFKNDSKISV